MSHLMTTKIVVGSCHACRRPVAVGIAEGLLARVDLSSVDERAEVAAILADRWTYTLTAGELVYRDAGRIAGRCLRGPVLAEHRCGNGPRNG
jgi:predicted ATPase